MGSIEKQVKRRNLQKLLLETLAVSGALSASLIAPNVIGAMKKMNLLPSKRQEESINRARNSLLKKGFLKKNKEGFLELTELGARTIEIKKYSKQAHIKKRWDGKWRILMFDIPNGRKGLRDKLRRSLRATGFTLFQNSVWVYPYPCDDLIALLKTDFKIGKDMRYIVADAIEGDEQLRKHFGLKK